MANVADKQIPETPISKAIEKLGGLSQVAELLKQELPAEYPTLSPQAVFGWRERGWAPPKVALWLEKKTGILREEMVHPELAPLFDGICDDVQS